MELWYSFALCWVKNMRSINSLEFWKRWSNHFQLTKSLGIEEEPFEIGEHLVNSSGKLELIDQLLQHLKNAGHKVLMFSQMTRMLDILQDFLTYRGKTISLKYSVCVYICFCIWICFCIVNAHICVCMSIYACVTLRFCPIIILPLLCFPTLHQHIFIL